MCLGVAKSRGRSTSLSSYGGLDVPRKAQLELKVPLNFHPLSRSLYTHTKGQVIAPEMKIQTAMTPFSSLLSSIFFSPRLVYFRHENLGRGVGNYLAKVYCGPADRISSLCTLPKITFSFYLIMRRIYMSSKKYCCTLSKIIE